MKDSITKNKLAFKLLFDVIMLILLTLMYNKMAIGMRFHEVGGLVLFGAFILHLVFNYRWIIGTTQKAFSKGLNVKARVGYIVNFLLLVSFTLVCISGILISKELFRFSSGMAWKTVHYSSASVALVLTGIHIGLHAKMILTVIKKKIALHPTVGKAIGVLCLAFLIIFGVSSIATTSFTRWITMPITMTSMKLPNEMQKGGDFADGKPRGEKPEQGKGEGRTNDDGLSFSFSNALLTVAQFTSITSIFSILTFVLEMLLGKRKLKQSPKPEF